MPQHKSAEKRVRQLERRRLRNRFHKSRLRTMIKNLMSATEKEDAITRMNGVKAYMQRMATKGIVHKNYAARAVGRMERFVNSIG